MGRKNHIIIRFQRTDDLGKYLGVPLHHRKVSSRTYRNIIDRASQRLSS